MTDTPTPMAPAAPCRSRPRWRRWVLVPLRLYVLYLLLLFLAQRWVVFPGQFRDAPGVDATALAATGGRSLPMGGGGKAWWFPPHAHFPTLVVFHGNGEIIEDWWPTAMDWNQSGYGVLLCEYPGYGGVKGPPGRVGMLAHAREAISLARPESRGPWIAIGVSLGSGVACELAAEGNFDGVALVAPFTSLAAMAHRRLAPGFLVRDRFDNLAAVARLPQPLLVVHGENDLLIPAAMGRKIAAASPGPVALHVLPGHGHVGVLGGDFLAIVNAWIKTKFPR